MDNLKLENLEIAKDYLVPYIFTRNYFNILKMKLENKKLSENERYYYNHFIKKKIRGMMELFGIKEKINGIEFIRKDRLKRAVNILKKYSNKHKNMKMFISGSFLYNKKYNDIDVFVISKYNKEDYRKGKIHVNYLPENIENTLFFQSILGISINNFLFEKIVEEKFLLNDILYLYELVILLILQGDCYISELRDLILRSEYMSNGVILNSMQLKKIIDRIIKSKFPIEIINESVIAKIIRTYDVFEIRRVLSKFIKKNSIPEKGKKLYKNWKIYNQTYKEVLGIVS